MQTSEDSPDDWPTPYKGRVSSPIYAIFRWDAWDLGWEEPQR